MIINDSLENELNRIQENPEYTNEISEELNKLLYEYYESKMNYITDHLIFDGFSGLNIPVMLGCFRMHNINSLYIIHESTALHRDIQTLLAYGFVLEGVNEIEIIRCYGPNDTKSALKFVRKN